MNRFLASNLYQITKQFLLQGNICWSLFFLYQMKRWKCIMMLHCWLFITESPLQDMEWELSPNDYFSVGELKNGRIISSFHKWLGIGSADGHIGSLIMNKPVRLWYACQLFIFLWGEGAGVRGWPTDHYLLVSFPLWENDCYSIQRLPLI